MTCDPERLEIVRALLNGPKLWSVDQMRHATISTWDDLYPCLKELRDRGELEMQWLDREQIGLYRLREVAS